MPQDIHAHCVPVGLLETLRREPEAYGIAAAVGGEGWRVRVAGEGEIPVLGALHDYDRRLAAMAAAGVRRQVLSCWIDLAAYGLEDAVGARYARLFNEAMAHTVAQWPERFDGLGTVPLQSPERAAAELRHAVTALGLVGVEILTTVGPRELDDRTLDPVWQAAEELRAIVLLHPWRPRGRDRLARHRLTDIVGNPSETSAAVGHLVLGGVLDRHPDLRVCLVHGGGTLPYLAGRFDALGATPAGGRPSEVLRRLYYDTLTHSPSALRALLDFAGPERVLLGSDYPFEVGDPDPVGSVDRVAGLSAETRAAVLGGNLDRLLGEVRRA